MLHNCPQGSRVLTRVPSFSYASTEKLRHMLRNSPIVIPACPESAVCLSWIPIPDALHLREWQIRGDFDVAVGLDVIKELRLQFFASDKKYYIQKLLVNKRWLICCSSLWGRIQYQHGPWSACAKEREIWIAADAVCPGSRSGADMEIAEAFIEKLTDGKRTVAQ